MECTCPKCGHTFPMKEGDPDEMEMMDDGEENYPQENGKEMLGAKKPGIAIVIAAGKAKQEKAKSKMARKFGKAVVKGIAKK